MSSVAIPANVRFLADLCCLNVRTTSNKDGAHSASELYKMLLEVRAWLDAPDPDHAAKWYKRRKAEEHTNILTESTTESMAQPDPKTWTSVFVSLIPSVQTHRVCDNVAALRIPSHCVAGVGSRVSLTRVCI